MNAKRYVRKPFYVEVIQVTKDNFDEAAVWCGGKVCDDGTTPSKYIQVHVLRPITARQTRAYAGDFILKTGDSYKVYGAKAFAENFEEAPEAVPAS